MKISEIVDSRQLGPHAERIGVLHWEDDEFVVTVDAQVAGQTLHRKEAIDIARWLSTALGSIELPVCALASTLVRPLLDALRNAADLDGHAIYDLLADTGIIRREIYDPEKRGPDTVFADDFSAVDADPGDEIWVLTELGKRFAGKEG